MPTNNGSDNGIKAPLPTDTVLDLSVQQRATKDDTFVSGSFWFGGYDDEVPAWWSERREQYLADFWKKPGNDILQGAISSMVKKFKSMQWVLEGPERVANRYQPVIAESEFGKGWSTLLTKTLTDYFTHDKGAFWELIGEGDPSGPLQGQVLGVAHLDSSLCQLTGDITYPVLFNNVKTGLSHKLHTTRVVHLVDMESPNEALNGVGWCAVSRVLASSSVLLKLARYKNEKLSDLPPAGMLLLNNIMPAQWEDTNARYKRERRRLGQELWTNMLVLMGLDPAQPVTAEFLSFATLPDAFNELEATNIYVNIVALAFGIDVREFWPMSQGSLGTGKESEIQAQKAKGKGVGDIISTLERAINWKVLPPAVTFRFDFQDSEEDRLAAEINKEKINSIMSMWQPASIKDGIEPPVTREELRQMLADNVPYFKEEFLLVDITDDIEVDDIERKYGTKIRVSSEGYVQRRKIIEGRYKWLS